MIYNNIQYYTDLFFYLLMKIIILKLNGFTNLPLHKLLHSLYKL
jgi:hypothetical protein